MMKRRNGNKTLAALVCAMTLISVVSSAHLGKGLWYKIKLGGKNTQSIKPQLEKFNENKLVQCESYDSRDLRVTLTQGSGKDKVQETFNQPCKLKRCLEVMKFDNDCAAFTDCLTETVLTVNDARKHLMKATLQLQDEKDDDADKRWEAYKAEAFREYVKDLVKEGFQNVNMKDQTSEFKTHVEQNIAEWISDPDAARNWKNIKTAQDPIFQKDVATYPTACKAVIEELKKNNITEDDVVKIMGRAEQCASQSGVHELYKSHLFEVKTKKCVQAVVEALEKQRIQPQELDNIMKFSKECAQVATKIIKAEKKLAFKKGNHVLAKKNSYSVYHTTGEDFEVGDAGEITGYEIDVTIGKIKMQRQWKITENGNKTQYTKVERSEQVIMFSPKKFKNLKKAELAKIPKNLGGTKSQRRRLLPMDKLLKEIERAQTGQTD